MEPPVWRDKDRLFVFWGLGISLNFKFIAKKLGLVKSSTHSLSAPEKVETVVMARSQEDRLREQIEASKYEEKR